MTTVPTLSEVLYAVTPSGHVAYRIAGSTGPPVMLLADWFSNVELMWEDGPMADALQRVASYCRLITFDKRGVGLSDPLPPETWLSMDEWIEDIGSVLSHLSIPAVTLVAVGSAGPMAMTYAASNPKRVRKLVLINSYARLARDDDYPAGIPKGLREEILKMAYTGAAMADGLGGSNWDIGFRTWWAKYQRHSVSPGVADVMRRMMFEVDVRSVLGSITAPTLILHRRDDPWIRTGHGKHLAQHIAGSELVELPGAEDLFYLGDVAPLVARIEEFVTGQAGALDSNRVLATVLFTDIVGSTKHAAEVGDDRWHSVLERYDAAMTAAVRRSHGNVIDQTGDGFFAVFDTPTRALRCAMEVRAELLDIGVRQRAGIHTGEVSIRAGGRLVGLAINVAARISALGGADEVLVSRTVRDLSVGSEFRFDERGEHILKGIDEPWTVYSAR